MTPVLVNFFGLGGISIAVTFQGDGVASSHYLWFLEPDLLRILL